MTSSCRFGGAAVPIARKSRNQSSGMREGKRSHVAFDNSKDEMLALTRYQKLDLK